MPVPAAVSNGPSTLLCSKLNSSRPAAKVAIVPLNRLKQGKPHFHSDKALHRETLQSLQA